MPPNNQGIATPFYNQGDDGEKPAKDGVATADQLDRYTQQSIASLDDGYLAFAGQRDDGFYGDIQAIFDLLQLRNPGKDAQGGFNLHLMALAIPIDELGGDLQIAGVYATTSRERVTILFDGQLKPERGGDWVQVARQGNPLFNEGLVAIEDKDLYSRTSPAFDNALFRKYAEKPELAKLLNLIVLEPDIPGIETRRTDIAGIFIPDVIKVDLSTESARLAGGGAGHPTNPDDAGFSRLGIFGGDVLISKIQPGFGGGTIPGGWPNGRRFGDDVVDIAVTALISDLRTSPPVIRGPGRRQRERQRHGVQQGVPVRVDAAERPPARPSLTCPAATACVYRRAAVLVAAALVSAFPSAAHAHDPGLSALDVRVAADRIQVSLSLAASDARQPAVGAIETFARDAIVAALDGAPLAVRAAAHRAQRVGHRRHARVRSRRRRAPEHPQRRPEAPRERAPGTAHRSRGPMAASCSNGCSMRNRETPASISRRSLPAVRRRGSSSGSAFATSLVATITCCSWWRSCWACAGCGAWSRR